MTVSREQAERSYAQLTNEHLARLFDLASSDHAKFMDTRPEYADRRVAVTLAQGAALHYLDGRNGVKDLDVWTFYAAIPGKRWPYAKRHVHVDFGPSELGRPLYSLADARTDHERNQWHRWATTHTGRRVDLFMRSLEVSPDAEPEHVTVALRNWLHRGARRQASKSAWHLARKAMVLLDPAARGQQVWPIPSPSQTAHPSPAE